MLVPPCLPKLSRFTSGRLFPVKAFITNDRCTSTKPGKAYHHQPYTTGLRRKAAKGNYRQRSSRVFSCVRVSNIMVCAVETYKSCIEKSRIQTTRLAHFTCPGARNSVYIFSHYSMMVMYRGFQLGLLEAMNGDCNGRCGNSQYFLAQVGHLHVTHSEESQGGSLVRFHALVPT